MNNFNSEKWIPWMRRALQLADLADGETSPNPLVGAVVLDSNDNLIGEGFHSAAGKPHAEVEALRQAGDASQGGTLMVTLEPCCHQGRTPPCTDLILNSGIKRVVIGLKDPDPRVSGKGIAILKSSGIDVITGVLEEEALYQNRAFVFRVQTGRPWGILKWAMSFDGRIGLPNGTSKWITSEDARSKVHALRAKCDAVIIGGGTLRADDPLLTSRGMSDPEPKRVVFTSSLDLPKSAKIWDTETAESIIAFGSEVRSEQLEQLPQAPSKLPLNESNPKELLEELAKKGCNRILWECGPSLATKAIENDCVQEIFVFMAPKLIGGLSSMNPLSNFGFYSMEEVFSLTDVSLEKIGKDFVLKMLLK
ncbi:MULTISPECIES: bifunctional diaminohydroxyphosphoribosylaminopyrimidine deaminase/5-amino-6-(5-phosphoribosylamino)uracil reductase RibD [Prochlorococcus]|uniref:bifunctional diaminohydroxyphosphoribosylaminopyrimidine deaminase/5-amino-6-(5-phosphoribosylamino)uracil reductase RibD n=1 Tax=Prochlorococcus TaxID=1218 RepID=UPI0005339435|nr:MULTISPECIES: bifunctional diaminohydroxyphosphoribosylaminopyrimidine deaminase/5-amino-6-(5-phosphoribosylamino)uracil reductase RibD [Prochlorococcus]KGG12026.1 Diaminohydroxyphosphoribosylaminopyrimidine deaminase [Prochlorococcus sp. MIT 0601]